MSHIPSRPDRETREPWWAKFIAWCFVSLLCLCIAAAFVLLLKLTLGACGAN